VLTNKLCINSARVIIRHLDRIGYLTVPKINFEADAWLARIYLTHMFSRDSKSHNRLNQIILDKLLHNINFL